MQQILIGGDRSLESRLMSWMAAWGLPAGRLPEGMHPAQVPVSHACAVIYSCGAHQPALQSSTAPVGSLAQNSAPLLLVGSSAPPDLRAGAWLRIADPGLDGEMLAAALRPCLESAFGTPAAAGFRDLVNHELRTPLTAAGTALQTLAMQLARVGGPSVELVDVALRNIRRLERTVDWACDYMTDGASEASIASQLSDVALVDLLEDLDDLAQSEPMIWSTGAGDWESCVSFDRDSWRRLLRQMLRAVTLLSVRQPIRLELSLLESGSTADSSPAGLLVVVNLQCPETPEARSASTFDQDAKVEQLRRLLAFTVNPGLARRMELRFDVMRLADRLRLRLMLPLVAVPNSCLCG